MKRFDYGAVTGHELICAKLRQAVAARRTVSAYLLAGPAGIGKKTLAYPFAAALLCEAPVDGGACLSCSSCRLLAADAHPDLICLEIPADKKSIGVEAVREQLIKEAYVRPFSSARKVFLIENGELMTAEAQNALLKILEEPPEYAVFLLLTTAQSRLLETIRSRCLKLQLLPLRDAQCRAYFQSFPHAPAERRALAAAFAQGNLGRGRKMLTDDGYYALYRDSIDRLIQLPRRPGALADIQQFWAENRENMEDIIDFMLVFLRDCLRTGIAGDPRLICADRQADVREFAALGSPGGLVRAMEAVIRFRERLQKNASFTAASLELLTRMQEEIHDQGNRSPI
ncbi:MAG: ATP-binding protein [Clostridia bacterium]